jgi:hypothetical protein
MSQVDTDVTSTELSYDDIIAFHSQQIYDVRDFIIRGDVFGRESFVLGLQRLIQLELITQEESEAIMRIIDTVYDGPSTDEVLEAIIVLIEAVRAVLGEVGRAIAAIIRSSVETAQELLGSIAYDDIRIAVAHDIRGALDGAVAGAELLSKLPRGRVAGAVVGAMLGAASASIIGQYQPEVA